MVVPGIQSKSASAKQTVQSKTECGSGALVTVPVYMLTTTRKVAAWSGRWTMRTTQHQKQKTELYCFRR
ncbi:hypothetical protein IscW_ISCW024693 [Ixodes scapularis]|uniref:Uncharacterized protein n=1 Tax=Ixodes scapularis TaxID=6945 RepID=B7Q784_IXOSC|nr:hypothetical protein IscW_ISCW024693 [Ixodes scapularis]|eukprot:XP_002412126.1 hypothetical protein IscW_ISCW024693 [Ixodes scapularis]